MNENRDYEEFYNKCKNISNMSFHTIAQKIVKNFGKEKISVSTLGRFNTKMNKGGFNPNKKGLCKLSFRMLIEYVESISPSTFNNNLFNGFDSFYYYFYSGKHDFLKKAIFCLKSENNEWIEGKIIYFNDDFKISSVFKITTIKPNSFGSYIYFYGIIESDSPTDHDSQINFYTLTINNNPIDKRYVFPISCSTLSKIKEKNIPVLNFGYLERIPINSVAIATHLSNTFINHKIDPWISNALLNKKMFLSPKKQVVFTNKEGFDFEKNSNVNQKGKVNLQFVACSKMCGNYLVFYPKNHISIYEDDDFGFACVLLKIKPDGNVKIKYSENDFYTGSIKFHNNQYTKIHCDIENRLNYYLECRDSYIDKLIGVITGFTSDDDVFSAPVVCYRMNDSFNAEVLIPNKTIWNNEFESFFENLNLRNAFNKTINPSNIRIDLENIYLNNIYGQKNFSIDK